MSWMIQFRAVNGRGGSGEPGASTSPQPPRCSPPGGSVGTGRGSGERCPGAGSSDVLPGGGGSVALGHVDWARAAGAPAGVSGALARTNPARTVITSSRKTGVRTREG
ncbi:hypothetical protein [Saccharomonospora sp. CUA-673]|uniref:hypothetical protein n=1 Tax=Saccharomonospora sp. CUA-673 TaxID=1904969 RepID=UPI002100A788|nr:hypothetical protein [Saccharomonospora sp. CUA-673]